MFGLIGIRAANARGSGSTLAIRRGNEYRDIRQAIAVQDVGHHFIATRHFLAVRCHGAKALRQVSALPFGFNIATHVSRRTREPAEVFGAIRRCERTRLDLAVQRNVREHHLLKRRAVLARYEGLIDGLYE